MRGDWHGVPEGKLTPEQWLNRAVWAELMRERAREPDTPPAGPGDAGYLSRVVAEDFRRERALLAGFIRAARAGAVRVPGGTLEPRP